jgi:hypothetical protein
VGLSAAGGAAAEVWECWHSSAASNSSPNDCGTAVGRSSSCEAFDKKGVGQHHPLRIDHSNHGGASSVPSLVAPAARVQS